jgi:hypothetical protein
METAKVLLFLGNWYILSSWTGRDRLKITVYFENPELLLD